MQRILLFMLSCFFCLSAFALASNDYLLKIGEGSIVAKLKKQGLSVTPLSLPGWYRVSSEEKSVDLSSLAYTKGVAFAQPNYPIHLIEDYGSMLQNPTFRDSQADFDIVSLDPLFNKQWGMKDINSEYFWNMSGYGSSEVVVAVIDTGVDYKHEDLRANIWKNPGETGLDSRGRDKANNGIDDDGNGYVDDTLGWDFVGKDNSPMDEASSPWEILFKGGNPGHGTHCAGNVAASANGLGIMGVAPGVKIMPLRFISKEGFGTTADAISSVVYAVDNGAKVLSNSWGSEGEDPNDPVGNQALRDAVIYAQDHNVLFIAAAGNGHKGVGYDNDSDPNPGYPASYDMETIVSVAAIDSSNKLGSFSNWGLKSVDLAAPGVKVYSTVPGDKYSDTVIDFLGVKAYWDGTSMATPHVAGAAALYWGLHPDAAFAEVKSALLQSTTPVSTLKNKMVSGGKLNLKGLLN